MEAHLRRRVAQLAELALELLAVLLGDEPDVEEAHHLPELHRRALHRPQRGDDLLGRLEVAALERGLLALVGSPEVGGAGAEVARRLARGEARHPRGPGDARGRDPVFRHQGVTVGVGVASSGAGVSAGVGVGVGVGVAVVVGSAVSVASGVSVAVGVAVGVGVSSLEPEKSKW